MKARTAAEEPTARHLQHKGDDGGVGAGWLLTSGRVQTRGVRRIVPVTLMGMPVRRHANDAAVGVTVVIFAVEDEAVEGCAGCCVPAAGRKKMRPTSRLKCVFL